MLYTLRNYQREAVDKIKSRLNLYLDESLASNSRNSLVFKSPTGSGKTFMMSSLFEEFIDENREKNFCVIWACPGKGELHIQSFENVKDYLGGNPLCSRLELDFFGSRKYIKKHEIVFVNWEKLIDKDKHSGKWINNLMKDQEGQNFLDVIDQTKHNGTKIILVVDESHIGKNADTRIQEFKKQVIIPDITIEMSATPLTDPDVTVDPEDVISDGMIKNEVLVNEGINVYDESLSETDSETLVLNKGYEKRLELLDEFKKIGSCVNPLVLIQIPNVDAGEAKKIIIKDFLRDKDVTEDNGKLKFWCDSKADFDKKQIKNNADVTEFLVFKTAVATGWDCPRAHILIKFRDGNSETFEIQTVGRILRTPEAMKYNNYILDNAYIFSNLKKIETKQETYNPNKLKTEFSYLPKHYDIEKVNNQTLLESFYRSREGDYNSAGSDFNKFFMKEFMDYFDLKDDDKYIYFSNDIESKMTQKGMKLITSVSDNMIAETSIETKYIDKEKTYSNDVVDVIMSENDVKSQYYEIIRQNLNGLAYVRSKSPINTAIIDAFSTFLRFERSSKIGIIQKMVVINKTIFDRILNNATKDYRVELQRKSGKKGYKYEYTFLDKRGYSYDTHLKIESVFKSLYQPLYVLKGQNGKPNKLELDFLKYLDMQNCVEWYFENGPELVVTNFGIPYNNGLNTFQPDFIVKFKNGTVGIFDTKAPEQRVEDTKLKAEALFKYCKEMNKKRSAPKVIGGIVVQIHNHFYYYLDNEYHDINQNHLGWEYFDDLISKIDNEIYNEEYLKSHNTKGSN